MISSIFRRLGFTFLVFSSLTPTLLSAEELVGTMKVTVVDYPDGSYEHKYQIKKDDGTLVPLSISDSDSYSRFALTPGARVKVTGTSNSARTLGVSSLTIEEVAPDSITGRAIGTQAVSGTRRVALILVNFDTREGTCTKAQAEEIMYTGSESVTAIYEASSRGQLTFERDTNGDGDADIFGPYTVAKSLGTCDSPGGWGQAAQDAMEASGVDADDYHHIVAIIPSAGCGWAGLGDLSCGSDCTAFSVGCYSYETIAHELGHNLGMHHASADYENDNNIDSEYGDGTCPMGGVYDYAMFNAPHQYQMGWFDTYTDKVLNLSQGGTYNLAPLEADSSETTLPQMIRIQASSNDYYYLSYRNNQNNTYGINWYLEERLSIHRMSTTSGAKTRFIGEQALNVGETFTDSTLGMTVCLHDQNSSAINFTLALNGDSCAIASEEGSPGETEGAVTGDSDGDGITDTQETADGTDPSDPGSYLERLSSPVYTLWNSFLGMTNILELVNPDSTEGSVTTVNVKLYAIDGDLMYSGDLSLAANQQYDLILDELPGFISESYGILKITYTGTLAGRLSYYKQVDSGDAYEFAYSVPLSRPLRGETGVSFNTNQPSLNATEANYQVLNWLSIVNLTSSTQDYTVKTYNLQGELIATRETQVEAFSRADIDGGHVELGAGYVGLQLVTPENDDAPYLAQMVRYGTEANPGESVNSYSFAFPLSAHAGNGRPVSLPISRQFGETNWVEVINVKNEEVSATLTYYNADGESSERAIVLPAYSQAHILIDDDILTAETRGHVSIVPNTANSLIAQSMFYYRNSDGSIAAMSGIGSRESLGSRYLGSYNLFLNMQNWLSLSNTSAETISVTVRALSSSSSGSTIITLAPRATTALPIHNTADLNTSSDTYGVLEIEPDEISSVIIDLHRVRYQGEAIDFSFPTEIRAR